MSSCRFCRLCFLLVLLLPTACKKGGFLDTKPNESQVVPSSIADCQALLDNDGIMNGYGGGGYPSMLENGSDDFYCSDAQYAGYPSADQNAVVWARTIFSDTSVDDWNLPYRTVFYSNLVLETLAGIHVTADNRANWNVAMGGALFFRAFAFYQLAQVFAAAYGDNADQLPGIPLRLSSDPSEKITRASLKASADQMVSDLQMAATLLPDHPNWFPTRPTLAAVYGLMARVQLWRGDYYTCLQYADSCLALRNALMEYDTVVKQPYTSFSRSNPEVIFAAVYRFRGPSRPGKSFVDSVLFASYDSSDQRKRLFFNPGGFFYGQYDEDGYLFCGLATDEIYLTRAECRARTGDVAGAMGDLNTLLRSRYHHFSDWGAVNADSALGLSLQERRKELLYRGLRWTDLKRLNRDARWAIGLKRSIGGQSYSLPPNDPRYVYPIPENVLAFNPGMIQNPR